MSPLLLVLTLLCPVGHAEEFPSIDVPVKSGTKAPTDAAVIIGVEDYWKLADVPYALRDAAAFYDWAVYTRGIPVARVERLDINPSAEQIAAAVKRAGAATTSGGTVWLYFSGHGMAARDGRRMVLGGGASGTSRAELEQDGAFLEDLEADAAAKGARVVAIIDACYTGEKILGDRTPVPPYSPPRRDVIEWLAAAANETSGPLEAVKHGAFTYFALGALRGWADGQVDGADGKVIGGEAQLYVESGLKAARITGQRPEMRGEGWSDLVLSTGVAVPAAHKPLVSSASSSSFGDIQMDDPNAKLAEEDCAKVARAAGIKARDARFGAEAKRVQAEATSAWTTLSAKGETCAKLTDAAARETCAKSVDAFVSRAKSASITLTAGDEVAKTVCGERSVRFEGETRSVPIGEASAGVALAARIRVGVVVAAVEVAEGKLSVNVSGGWADVFVDGKKVGTTPLLGQQLAAGTHTIRVMNASVGLDETKAVTIRSGETSVAAFTVVEAEPVASATAQPVATAAAYGGASVADFESPTLGTMKWIPAGTFLMGSPPTEAGRGEDETQHQVTLSRGYWMMEHEVTRLEWNRVMVAAPGVHVPDRPMHPVEKLSWDAAVAFAAAASMRDGVVYRLPTEAEWERAARGGRAGDLYAGGNDWDEVGWCSFNSGASVHAICEKARNGYGLCDMTGNVAEWTADGYGPSSPSSIDPQGAASGSSRVIRGGAAALPASYARVARRRANSPSDADYFVGFRLVRSAP